MSNYASLTLADISRVCVCVCVCVCVGPGVLWLWCAGLEGSGGVMVQHTEEQWSACKQLVSGLRERGGEKGGTEHHGEYVVLVSNALMRCDLRSCFRTLHMYVCKFMYIHKYYVCVCLCSWLHCVIVCTSTHMYAFVHIHALLKAFILWVLRFIDQGTDDMLCMQLLVHQVYPTQLPSTSTPCAICLSCPVCNM